MLLNRKLPDALRLFRQTGRVTVSQHALNFSTFAQVAEFMHAAGHLDLGTNYFQKKFSPEMLELYMRFVVEEYKETMEAYANWRLEPTDENLAKLVDGFFDLQWVTKGASLSTGLPQKLVWEEGAWSNLTKIDAESGQLRKRHDGKVLKPEGWTPPDFLAIIKATQE